MIITFSSEFYAKQFHSKSDGPGAFVCGVTDKVSVKSYRLTWKNDSPIGNLYAAITWAKGRRVRDNSGMLDLRYAPARKGGAI